MASHSGVEPPHQLSDRSALPTALPYIFSVSVLLPLLAPNLLLSLVT